MDKLPDRGTKMRIGKPKQGEQLTDAERHKRFKAMAGEVAAEDAPDAFDRAFASIDTTAKPGAPE